MIVRWFFGGAIAGILICAIGGPVIWLMGGTGGFKEWFQLMWAGALMGGLFGIFIRKWILRIFYY